MKTVFPLLAILLLQLLVNSADAEDSVSNKSLPRSSVFAQAEDDGGPPSDVPSDMPSDQPSDQPSWMPSDVPSMMPSCSTKEASSSSKSSGRRSSGTSAKSSSQSRSGMRKLQGVPMSGKSGKGAMVVDVDECNNEEESLSENAELDDLDTVESQSLHSGSVPIVTITMLGTVVLAAVGIIAS